MTDSRLPGHWLNEMRFMDLTDRQWRIFTNGLMWSNEQATDGYIPDRYLRLLHPKGVEDADIDALVNCEVLERTDGGLQFVRWSDPNGLRQSLAADVRGYRDRKRQNQAAYRERRKAESVTGHVGGNVAGQVGEGYESSSKASAYVTGHGDRQQKRRQFGQSAPDYPTVQPGSDCGEGSHRWQPDGTCLNCDRRDTQRHDEWINR